MKTAIKDCLRAAVLVAGLILLLMAAGVTPAEGQTYQGRTLQAAWDKPLLRANGEPLEPGELAGYMLTLRHNGEKIAEITITGGDTTTAAFDFDQYITDYGYTNFSIELAGFNRDGLLGMPTEPIFFSANGIAPPGAISVRVVYEYNRPAP